MLVQYATVWFDKELSQFICVIQYIGFFDNSRTRFNRQVFTKKMIEDMLHLERFKHYSDHTWLVTKCALDF